MMQCWKRLAAAAIAIVMMLTMFPVHWVETAKAAETVTGTVTADEVFLRKQPAGSTYWFKLPKDFTCTVLGSTTKNGVLWYKVESKHPSSTTKKVYTGYIHSDYFVVAEVEGDDEGSVPEGEEEDVTTGDTGSTDTGSTAPEGEAEGGASGSTAGGTTDEETITVGEVNADGVNFRKKPDGAQIARLKKGTRVEILETPEAFTAEYWFKVAYDGDKGYIQAPYVTVLGTTTGGVNDFGAVRLLKTSANLRAAPGGKVLAVWEKPGEVLPVTGPTQTEGGYTWYPVLYQGGYYFVRNDCVQLVSGISSGSGNTGSTAPEAVLKGYLKTTKSGVNLRQEPGGKVKDQIDKGVTVKRMSDEVKADGYKWYLVDVDGVMGYMRSDCVTHVDTAGDVTTPPADNDPPASEEEEEEGDYGYVVTTKSGVNLRDKPAGSSKEQIAKGVVLPLTGKAVTSGKYQWYPVRTQSGKTGYVRGDCVALSSSDGSDITPPEEENGGAGEEEGSTGTTTPDPVNYGYVMITSSSVNVRKTPGGAIQGQVKKNAVWPMTGSSTVAEGYTWYPINADGLKGYVRGDHSFKLSAAQEESYLAGNGVPEDNGNAVVTTKYVQTIKDNVYLRASASTDAEHPFQVKKDTVMSFDMYKTVGGKIWYRVIYSNKQVWVRGDCVKVMTEDEYNDYIAANPEDIPQTEILLGYVKTTTNNVNVRVTPGSSNKLGTLEKGTVVSYSAVETEKGYTWYYAKTELGKGYLREDVVTPCDENGDSLSSGGSTGGSSVGDEASYTTLKRGSQGTAVKNLVTELKAQGYYSGDITSSFTSSVENAVKAFQSANGLNVDGIAGEQTQHKLFGTVPVGSGNGNLSFTIYPAEKVDWYKGDIQQLWPKGASFKVYDVKTGIVWWARRWSGAYHADVETLTAADSARLCKIYGTNTTQEIWDKNLWQRRPSLVTIGNRTFACSLFGMPHNEDGDTIKDNDMTGQICIHFTNSKIHGSNQVDEDHQDAIEAAYQYAKNGDPR